MLIVLLGKSCSGKDTLQRELMNDGAKKLVVYTTRPIREGEKDGVDYHFVSKEKYAELLNSGFFLESVDYHTKVDDIPDIWSYGSSKESYRAVEKTNDIYTIILTRPGLRALKASGIEHLSIYLDVPDEELKRRQELRHDNRTEAKRRFDNDKIDFAGAENEADITLHPDGHSTPRALADAVWKEFDIWAHNLDNGPEFEL